MGLSVPKELEKAKTLTSLTESLMDKIDVLAVAADAVPDTDDVFEIGNYYRDTVIPAMSELRAVADTLETMVATDYWPFPTYTDLLYRV